MRNVPGETVLSGNLAIEKTSDGYEGHRHYDLFQRKKEELERLMSEQRTVYYHKEGEENKGRIVDVRVDERDRFPFTKSLVILVEELGPSSHRVEFDTNTMSDNEYISVK